MLCMALEDLLAGMEGCLAPEDETCSGKACSNGISMVADAYLTHMYVIQPSTQSAAGLHGSSTRVIVVDMRMQWVCLQGCPVLAVCRHMGNKGKGSTGHMLLRIAASTG
jgi:hypothetical protein